VKIARLVDSGVTEAEFRNWLYYHVNVTQIFKRPRRGHYTINKELVFCDTVLASRILVQHLGLERIRQIEQQVGLHIIDERVYAETREAIEELFSQLEKHLGEAGKLLREFYLEVVAVSPDDARRLINLYKALPSRTWLRELIPVAVRLPEYVACMSDRAELRQRLNECEAARKVLEEQLRQIRQEVAEELTAYVYDKQTGVLQLQVLVRGMRQAVAFVKKLTEKLAMSERALAQILETLREAGLITSYEIKKQQ